MLPTLLTIRETAAALKLSQSAVRSLVDKQLLKVTRVGAGRGRGVVRVFEASVLEYLEGRATESIGKPIARAPRLTVGFKALERLGYEWPGKRQPSSARSSGRDAHNAC